MGKFNVALLSVCALALGVTSHAVAFEGGGRKPSEAPLIVPGQHYTAQLNNHKSEANFESIYGHDYEVALYRLPPVDARDQITVNWHVLPYATGGGFPVCMALIQGIDDFNWGNVFGSATSSASRSCDESGPVYGVSGTGSGRNTITMQSPDATSTYLAFYEQASEDEPADFETFPYDFSVEGPRHFLGLAFAPKQKVHANGVVKATATLANGLPAPDGLPFDLSVTWGDSDIANYTTTSLGGQAVFALALPESAIHQRAVFVVSHPADAYQPVYARIPIQVTSAVASAAEIACAKSTQRAHALARQVKRLKRNARFARGATKRRLKQRARHLGREWSAARSRAQAACG